MHHVNRIKNFFEPPEDRPPESTLAWCENLVRILTDGAVWCIPRSQTIFLVDKVNKKLILISPGDDNGDDFRATKQVFAHIGWAVVTQEETDGTT